jgi:chromosome segregation ATPase
MGFLAVLWQIVTFGFAGLRSSVRNQAATADSMGEHLERLQTQINREEAKGRRRDNLIDELLDDVRTLRKENDELRAKLDQCEERHECDIATIAELRGQLETNNAKIAELERRLFELTGDVAK